MMATLKYSDFINAFKNADTKEEQAVALIDAFQQIRDEQHAEVLDMKQDVLKEIKLEDLTTKTDLSNLDSSLKLYVQAELEKTKFSFVKWMVGIILGGVWIPIGIALLSHHY